MYGDLAWTWPIISAPETYVQESEQFCALIRQHSRIEPQTLLNLGCGGGHNDHTLKRHFRVTGVDVSEAMLGLARRRNPEVSYLLGDMRTLRLGEVFDCVTAFDSLSYMLTEEDLGAAFQTAFSHLRPGGVFVTYQETNPATFEQNRVAHQAGTQGDVEIVFIENEYDPDPSDATVESTFVYLIRRGGRLQVEVDHHLGGIFPTETWLAGLRDAGFEVAEVRQEAPKEPTIFVCVRPS
jgi:SAM-dependent methyltransferase